MKPERGIISPQDLTFAVFCFMQATVLRSGYIISVTRNDSWAMAVAGLVTALPIVAIYAALMRKFPGKNLMEIDDIVYGPVLGRAVSALYLFFFLSLAALNARDLGNFVVDYMMPETPIAAVILVLVAGCAYVIRKGIENLLHLSTAFCVIAVGALIVNSILLSKDARLEFLKPFFRLEPMKYVQGTVSVAAVPMGELLTFTMFAPMLGRGQSAAKPMLLGLTFSTVSMAMIMLRDILTLGPLVSIVSLPSFESVRYVSLADILTRMESVYAVVMVLLFSFKVSILLYASALGLTQILGVRGRPREDAGGAPCEAARLERRDGDPPFMLITAALVFFYSLFVFESVMENMDWGATAAPFFSLTFEFLLPAASLLTALLRRLGGAREAKA